MVRLNNPRHILLSRALNFVGVGDSSHWVYPNQSNCKLFSWRPGTAENLQSLRTSLIAQKQFPEFWAREQYYFLTSSFLFNACSVSPHKFAQVHLNHHNWLLYPGIVRFTWDGWRSTECFPTWTQYPHYQNIQALTKSAQLNSKFQSPRYHPPVSHLTRKSRQLNSDFSTQQIQMPPRSNLCTGYQRRRTNGWKHMPRSWAQARGFQPS